MKSVNTAHEEAIEKLGNPKDRLKASLSEIEHMHENADHLDQASSAKPGDPHLEALRRLDRIITQSGQWWKTYRNQPEVIGSGILFLMDNVKVTQPLGELLQKIPRLQPSVELLHDFLKEKENERIARPQKMAGSQS